MSATTTRLEAREAHSEVGRLTLMPAPIVAGLTQLGTKGYTVVPGVLSRERAAYHVDQAFQWLEDFALGFKPDDRSTWTKAHLPFYHRGGMFNRHGVQHEQWVWDIRSEPGLVNVFAQIWGTDELLVSFDAVNISLPRSEDNPVDDQPWPHVDQSPLKREKHCVQGIMNLYEVGPQDGSLMVLDGSFTLYNEFFDSHKYQAPEGGWNPVDFHSFSTEDLHWFYERGCTWKKILAEPGDLILWDSRTVHYGAHAEGDRPRVATYVCYKPANQASEGIIQKRRDFFAKSQGTSHDPIDFRATGALVNGKLAEDERVEPRKKPVLSKRSLQLVGVEAYV